MNRAGFYVRLVALTIDAVAMTALMAGTAYVLWEPIYYAAADAGIAERADYLLALIQLGAVILYSASDIFFAGTPGKLLFRLRIANFDGTRPPVSRLILRWLTKYQPLIYYTFMVALEVPVLEVMVGLTWWIVGIGCLWAMRDSRLAWHDEWAWTSVVWRGEESAPSSTPIPVPPSIGAA